MAELKPCPFCGGEMAFFRHKEGKHFVQYWMHALDCDCVLDDIGQPFTIGAGDAKINSKGEVVYVGEYGEKWNRRAEAALGGDGDE